MNDIYPLSDILVMAILGVCASFILYLICSYVFIFIKNTQNAKKNKNVLEDNN